MLNSRKYYVYAGDELKLREIRWFRLKFVGSILALVTFLLGMILTVNHLYYDFLGLGSKITALELENKILSEKLISLNEQIKSLGNILNDLNQQGNNLRLMVDLPPIDEQTKRSGIGGAVEKTDISYSSNTIEILNATNAAVKQLMNEVTLQKQSYQEIHNKYMHNKALFSVLPAIKPMEGFYSPTGFGLRKHPVLGIYKTHEGLDIFADVGTPVFATGDGTVEFAGRSGGGYGNVVLLNHGYGYQSLYAHLSQVLVKEGQRVQRGTLIGKSGRTGLVSGPHLHYEVIYKGKRQNPADFFLDDSYSFWYKKE